MKKILKLLLVPLLFGCSTTHDPRMVGTFVSDRDATIAYLQGTGKYTQEQLQTLSRVLGKWKIECDGETVVATMDDSTRNRESFRIVERTNESVVVETDSNGERTRTRLIFTDDGYWEVGENVAPPYREKFTRIIPPAQTGKGSK